MGVLSVKPKNAPQLQSFRTAVYVLEELARAGVDIAPLLRSTPFASLSGFRHGGDTLQDRQLDLLAYGAIHELGRIVRSRENRPLPREADWQLLVCCLLSCHSLRDAITRMNDFFVAIDGRCGFTSLHVSPQGDAELRFECMHTVHDRLTLLLDVIGMANMFGLLRWLVADPIPVVTAALPYPDACTVEWVDFYLPFAVDTTATQTAIFFPLKYLDHPVMRSAADYDARSLDFAADSRGEASSSNLVDQARFLMYETLRREGTIISLDTLADRLGRNRETVRRLLKNSGSSYSAIKDSCRRQLGLSLLRRTDLRIEEVAVRLDFCDSDALRRAVQDWVGMSPSEYRRSGASISRR